MVSMDLFGKSFPSEAEGQLYLYLVYDGGCA